MMSVYRERARERLVISGRERSGCRGGPGGVLRYLGTELRIFSRADPVLGLGTPYCTRLAYLRALPTYSVTPYGLRSTSYGVIACDFQSGHCATNPATARSTEYQTCTCKSQGWVGNQQHRDRVIVGALPPPGADDQLSGELQTNISGPQLSLISYSVMKLGLLYDCLPQG
jgi:hypothetical protein